LARIHCFDPTDESAAAALPLKTAISSAKLHTSQRIRLLIAKVYTDLIMLQELIHNARRRLLFNEVLKQFAISAALAIGGVALLLTLGTRYLQWWAVALFALAVIVRACVKLRHRLPSDYAAALWLDAKADLHDSLSTAHHFATKSASLSPAAEAILIAQRGQAEAAATNVD